jgi:hypothetical protein
MSETVTPQREPGSKGGMNLFGWLMFLGMVILLIPLLPLYLLLKLVSLVTGAGGPDR